MPHLTAIHVYPMKSAGGLSPAEWKVDAFGFERDRRWMVVDSRGRMLTQRSHPRLALIRPSLDGDTLRVEAAGMPSLELPASPSAAMATTVIEWGDVCSAVWAGERAARWFSDLLDGDCSLVYIPDDTIRPANPAYVPDGTRVSFADAFPLLLISEEPLADRNRRLDPPLPMNLFRPNLVIAGGEAYGEDSLPAFRIGPIEFRVVKPCARCAVTTTDQASAARGVEPLRTLATCRQQDG